MQSIVTEFTSAAVSDRGLNEGRPHNEDSFVDLPQHGLFAVADGVGGAQAGEVASQMAVEILAEAFSNMGPNADPEDTMRIAIERANGAIYQMSNDLPQLASMATTLVAVHVSGDMATIAHVGDSRLYRADANGRLFRETDDHSVVEEEVRAGRMTPQQALNHPSRNVISRALGAEENVVPDLKCTLIHPGTTFLLCSDGITRHIDDTEIAQLLNSEFGPDDICARMKEICFSRGAEDNLTAVIVRFSGDRTIGEPDSDEVFDAEEATVAGVRESARNGSETVDNIEVPTYAGSGEEESAVSIAAENTPSPADDEDYLLEEPASIYGDERESAEIDETLDDADAEERTAAPSAIAAANSTAYAPQVTSFEAEPPQRSFPTILVLLIGLVVGAALGAAGGYYMLKSALKQAESVQPPAISEQKSNNVPLTSFEETRRIVDADPVKYLNARAATPQEAADFFWLGRALLLTAKPIEAKRAYEQARNLLPTGQAATGLNIQEAANLKTMSTEIGMALAIIDSPQAMEILKKELEVANRAAQANSNSNTIANIATPVR